MCPTRPSRARVSNKELRAAETEVDASRSATAAYEAPGITDCPGPRKNSKGIDYIGVLQNAAVRIEHQDTGAPNRIASTAEQRA
jgi:hypothetical protein